MDWPGEALFQNLKLACCRKCGMGYVTPDVSEDRLYSFYESAYRTKGSRDYLNPSIVRFHRWGASARPLAQIMLGLQYAPFEAGDRFLDIGAGNGAALDVVHKVSPEVRLCAIEPSDDVRRMFEHNFPGIVVYPDIENAFGGNDHFKMVLMSHSLEHFNAGSIEALLTQIAVGLDDHGILIIEVPHVDLRMAETAERPNDAPHLCFFSVEALTRLLEKTGFDVSFIDTCDRMIARSCENPDSTAKPRYEAGTRAKLSAIVPSAIWRLASRLCHPGKEILGLIGKGDPVIQWATMETTRYGGRRSCLRAVAKIRR